MKVCRVCLAPLGAPDYLASSPALTSVATLLDLPTRAYVCEACSHAQSPDLPDLSKFYDQAYRISLSTEDHDQIVEVRHGRPIFRSDHQATISLKMLDLRHGALVLDYGAAKAKTLRLLVEHRPDIVPHVFDVSSDYSSVWKRWIAAEYQATYDVPEHWVGRFDAVILNFVVEHLSDPVGILKQIRDLLNEHGRAIVSVPDVQANPGDMVVADHLNHFSLISFQRALSEAGLVAERLDDRVFPGAFFACVRRNAATTDNRQSDAIISNSVQRSRDICEFWSIAGHGIDRKARELQGQRVMIYGAGFYGSWIFSRVRHAVEVLGFLDRNPALAGTRHFDLPVLTPEDALDDLSAIFVGLNPLRARDILEHTEFGMRWQHKLVWLDSVG